MKKLTRPFKIKSIADDGTFDGYGSVFDVIDSYKEVVLPGAFKATIADFNERGAMPALLWQHHPCDPIGIWTAMAEDEHGLLMSGKLALDVQRGSEAYSLLKMGAVKGLSIGYSIPKGGSEYDKDADVTNLKEIELWETSLVTFPANPDAQITDVRTALTDGIYPTMREVESLLRDSGFSKKDSQTILSNGYRDFLERDARDLLDLERLLANLKRIN